MRRRQIALATLAATFGSIGPSAAQNYPTRPIRMVVPFAPGGATDIVGKAVIVHKDADDFKTQPTGNSGARVACGVIRKS